MAKAYIVAHTHWDREWYFSTMDSLVLSEQLFSDILYELKANKEVNFVLDGQSSILDSYIELHPENLELVKQLVQEKRLFIGPWFTQSDCLLPSEESILRNLMIGIKECRKYGGYMEVGYLPDTFGFNAQMPTILSQAGIHNIVFWRGVNFERLAPSPYFTWKGLGTKKITAINITHGYPTGALMNDSQRFIDKRLDVEIDFLVDKSKQEDVLIPVGGDQLNIIPNLDKIVASINPRSRHESVLSSYAEFIKVIEAKNDLPVYEGEFRDAVYTRVHRTIGSVRQSIKMANFNLEQKLVKRVEPLLVIARAQGIEISNELLIKAWKKVLESQAHDSIAGCVNDSVAEDILHRYKEADELCDGIENTIMKKIFQGAALQENEILFVNSEAHDFEGYKEFTLLVEDKNIAFKDVNDVIVLSEERIPERHHIMALTKEDGYTYIDEPSYYFLKLKAKVKLPALGYTTLTYEKSDQPLRQVNKTKDTTISNGQVTLSFQQGNLVFKQKDKEIINVIQLVDSGNDGDTYDYSPLDNESEKVLNFDEAYTIESDTIHTLVVSGKTLLPYTLEDRMKQDPNVKECSYQIAFTLSEDSNLMDAKLTFQNNINSHRLRIKCNTSIQSDFTVAQIQAGFVEHRNVDAPKNWEAGFVEKPVNIYNFNKSISMYDEENSFSLYAKGMLEYEQIQDTLLLSVCSTTGELGKPNLKWRPGRASGDTTMKGHIMTPTPMAQELGVIEAEFALEFSNEFDEKTVFETANQWLQPSIVYQSQEFNCFVHRLDNRLQLLPSTYQMDKSFTFKAVPDELIVNAIYPSYYDDTCFIARFINPTNKAVNLPDKLFDKTYVCMNAIEDQIDAMNVIAPYDMVSVKIKY